MKSILSMLNPLKIWRSSSSDQALEEDLRQAIESINPLLSQSTGYPRQYRKALRNASSYVDQLINQVPGPINLDSESFGNNPLVRSLFASPNELKEKLKLSIAMHEYSSADDQPQQIFALMGVRWSRVLHFGVEQEGEVLHSDVPQHTIDFRDHTFTLPASSEQEARQLLRGHFLQRLSNQVRQETHTLEEEREALYRQGKQLEAEVRTTHDADTSEQANQAEAVWEQWRAINQQLDTNHAIHHFRKVMVTPEESLRLEPYQLSIDRMGIERTPEQGGTPLDFVNLYGSDRRIWTIMLVQFEWQRPPSTQEQLEQAHRWLSIS